MLVFLYGVLAMALHARMVASTRREPITGSLETARAKPGRRRTLSGVRHVRA